jgi:hypothetical protein
MTTVKKVLLRVRHAPALVKAGAGCGVVAGLALGLIVSAPVGIVLGLTLGALAGIAAGTVMDREDQRTSLRSRELDAIIGVTTGNLGSPPSVPPCAEDADDEGGVHKADELASWLAEWMTPPPPAVG